MRWRLPLWSVIGVWAALFSLLSVLRYQAFDAGRFDLGNMVQAVWSTAHGHWLEVTNLQGEQVSRLASHFDPVLGAFAPLWLVWPSPESLLVAQAIVLSLGALPAYRLAHRHLLSERAGLAFALAYLLYPATQWLALNEFHPVALAAPLLVFAVDYLDQNRLAAFSVFAVPAMACKEEIGFVVAGFGIWYALARRRRLEGAAIALVGIAVSVIAVKVVVPHFHGGASPFGSRYRHVAAGDLFSARSARYLAELLLPLGALPLLAPLALVAAVPEAALNLLSSNHFQSSIRFHYTGGLIPPLLLAAVLGAEGLARRRPALARAVVPALLLLGAAGTLSLGAARLHGVVPNLHDRQAVRTLSLIPPQAAVSATNTLGAHLSARRRILSFPALEGAEWVILDTTRLSYLDRSSGGEEARRAYRALRRSASWRVLFSRSGVVLIRRRRPPTSGARARAPAGRPRAARPRARSGPRRGR
jgi:uncharacterized membrane protein